MIIRGCWSEVVDGLWVGAFVSKRESQAILPRLREALALIKERDPYRYKRVLRHFDTILVLPMPNQGECVPDLRRCVVNKELAETGAIDAIASVIVHEATHGELFRRGIGYQEAARQRVEDICTRQELAFAKKLTREEVTREHAAWKLDLPEDSWSDQAMLYRDIEWLRQQGWPNWLLKAILVLRKWRDNRALLRRHVGGGR
jgi:hypothetical protein